MEEGETFYEFNKRIREEASEKLRKRVVAESHKTEKRKEYYASKKEEKKRKRMGADSDEEQDVTEGKISDFKRIHQDSVKFGEQAQRPPVFKHLPKHSSKVDAAIAQRVSMTGTTSSPLTAFKEKRKAATITRLSEFDPTAAPTTTVRKTVQNEAEKKAMEVLRERVQEQYRKMKAAKLAAHTPASVKPIDRAKKKKSVGFTFSKEDMERFQEMRPESKRGLKKAKKEQNWWRY